MPVEIADTLAFLQQRRRAAARASAARRTQLEARLPQARAILRAHGANRCWVFGSIATDRATPDSDLDIAVEGLSSERYFDALGDLLRVLPCEVDLVRLEDAPATLVDRVLTEGRLL